MVLFLFKSFVNNPSDFTDSSVLSSITSFCNGDYDISGFVDISDFGNFGHNYKKIDIDCKYDLVGNDCYLNAADFGSFSTTYKVNGACTVISPPPPVPPPSSQLREWSSTTWSNGVAREILTGKRDPYDSLFIVRGNGKANIDGHGVATISGDSPRMYLYDEPREKKWGDVEVKVYAMRVSESATVSSQGFTIGVRSEHQDATDTNCKGRTYYARVLYDGRVNFQKELVHHQANSLSMPRGSDYEWATNDGKLPKNVWIGIKFIAKNVNDNQHVKFELYLDKTGDSDGEQWEKILEFTDDGAWDEIDSTFNVSVLCGYGPEKVFTESGTSVFIRNDEVSSAKYKNWSVKEISQ